SALIGSMSTTQGINPTLPPPNNTIPQVSAAPTVLEFRCSVPNCSYSSRSMGALSTHTTRTHCPSISVCFRGNLKYSVIKRDPTDNFLYCPCGKYKIENATSFRNHAIKCSGTDRPPLVSVPQNYLEQARSLVSAPQNYVEPLPWYLVVRKIHKDFVLSRSNSATPSLVKRVMQFQMANGLPQQMAKVLVGPGQNGTKILPACIPQHLEVSFLQFIEPQLREFLANQSVANTTTAKQPAKSLNASQIPKYGLPFKEMSEVNAALDFAVSTVGATILNCKQTEMSLGTDPAV
ncbi:hypothetical protein BCR33DRAFT_718403, partial [Rhizoclosmatium globosum]